MHSNLESSTADFCDNLLDFSEFMIIGKKFDFLMLQTLLQLYYLALKRNFKWHCTELDRESPIEKGKHITVTSITAFYPPKFTVNRFTVAHSLHHITSMFHIRLHFLYCIYCTVVILLPVT